MTVAVIDGVDYIQLQSDVDTTGAMVDCMTVAVRS